MKRFVLAFLVILSLAIPSWAQTVAVAAAANLSAVEAPLKVAFAAQHPGMALQFTFGASGALVTQITQGAPFQVFLSADLAFAQKLVDSGLATGPVKTYGVGKLIFLATKPLDLSKGIAVVLDPAVLQFANGNPETAPYGRAAVEAMTKAGIYEQAKAKQVLGQNVAQALQFTLTATNFGFVNKSALYSKDVRPYDQEGKFWFEIDPKLYAPIEQGYVVLKAAEARPEVKAFAAFLLSPEAQKVFEAFGYGKP
jgi:molybdate transport system substrate-binding protein